MTPGGDRLEVRGAPVPFTPVLLAAFVLAVVEKMDPFNDGSVGRTPMPERTVIPPRGPPEAPALLEGPWPGLKKPPSAHAMSTSCADRWTGVSERGALRAEKTPTRPGRGHGCG